MSSSIMKQVRFTSFPVGDVWDFVVTYKNKEVASGSGFLTQKDADMAGYKEKQRIVNKIQKGEIR